MGKQRPRVLSYNDEPPMSCRHPYRTFYLPPSEPRVRGCSDAGGRRVSDAIALLRAALRHVHACFLRDIRMIKPSEDCGLDPTRCIAVRVGAIVFFGRDPESLHVVDVALALGREGLHAVEPVPGHWGEPHACANCMPPFGPRRS